MKERNSRRSLWAAAGGQVAVATDGVIHVAAAGAAITHIGRHNSHTHDHHEDNAYAPHTHSDHSHNHTEVPHTHDHHEDNAYAPHTHSDHSHSYTEVPHTHGHHHSPVKDAAWGGLSAILLVYVGSQLYHGQKQARNQVMLEQENSLLENKLRSYGVDIENLPPVETESTPSRMPVIGAALAGAQALHVGSHLLAGGALAFTAANQGFDNLLGIAALVGSGVVVGSLAHHAYSHRKGQQAYAAAQQRNATLENALELQE